MNEAMHRPDARFENSDRLRHHSPELGELLRLAAQH
jgi:hypothetical protein